MEQQCDAAPIRVGHIAKIELHVLLLREMGFTYFAQLIHPGTDKSAFQLERCGVVRIRFGNLQHDSKSLSYDFLLFQMFAQLLACAVEHRPEIAFGDATIAPGHESHFVI